MPAFVSGCEDSLNTSTVSIPSLCRERGLATHLLALLIERRKLVNEINANDWLNTYTTLQQFRFLKILRKRYVVSAFVYSN